MEKSEKRKGKRTEKLEKSKFKVEEGEEEASKIWWTVMTLRGDDDYESEDSFPDEKEVVSSRWFCISYFCL